MYTYKFTYLFHISIIDELCHVYMYVFGCFFNAHDWMYMYIDTCVSICIHIYMYVCTRICRILVMQTNSDGVLQRSVLQLRTHTHAHTRTHTHTYTHTHTQTQTHTHTHTRTHAHYYYIHGGK